jgi:hypothetical protein
MVRSITPGLADLRIKVWDGGVAAKGGWELRPGKAKPDRTAGGTAAGGAAPGVVGCGPIFSRLQSLTARRAAQPREARRREWSVAARFFHAFEA